jgi:hypothetical protein
MPRLQAVICGEKPVPDLHGKHSKTVHIHEHVHVNVNVDGNADLL